MIYLICFEGVKQIEESKHSLPQRMTMTEFEDNFLFKRRMQYDFEQPEDYEVYSGDIDRIVLSKWEPVLDDMIYDMADEVPKFIFASERDRRLFSVMKGKFKLHFGALGYYSLEAMTVLADSEEKQSEFALIKENLHDEYANAAEERNTDNSGIEAKIQKTGEKYGMKIEMRDGTAFVTTYAGQWHFAYNDRPITLYHSNSIPVKDRRGNMVRYSHIQPVELYSPLEALSYIRNHEAAEEKRLMK